MSMLYRDTQQIQQPEGTSRFKLNIVRDSTDGSKGSDVSEIGNKRVFFGDEPIVGTIAIGPLDTILFVGTGKIYLQQKETFTLLKDLPCFAFDYNYPITGTFQTVRGCERIVYWADGVNPDRYFNLDKADQFQTCNDFGITPKLSHPGVTATLAASGGNLEYGSYRFVFELLDYSQNLLLRTLPSEETIVGDALNLDTFSAEVGGLPPTTKSILLQIENIDLRAKYIRVVALTKTSGNGATITAHSTPSIPINGRQMSYRYVGFNPSNGDVLVDFKEALSEHVVYTTSLDITQAAKRMLRMNLKDSVRDYGVFQRAASKISTGYLVEQEDFGPDILSEQGDEVKAYGIVYVFDNGTISPAFHIPGPLAETNERRIISSRFGPGDTSSKITKTITLRVDASTRNSPGRDRVVVISYRSSTSLQNIKFIVKSGSDEKTIESNQQQAIVDTEIDGRTAPITIEINVIDRDGARYSRTIQFSNNLVNQQLLLQTSSENLYDAEDLEYWQVYNTAKKDGTAAGPYHSSGTFGVYESSEQYLNPQNYCTDGSYWGTDVNGKSLLGSKVRYHRIPCRTLEPLKVDGKAGKIGVRFGNVTYPSADIVGHFFVSSTYEEGNRTIASAGYAIPYNYLDDTGADSKDDTGRYIHYLPNTFDNARPTNTINQNYISLPYLIDRRVVQGRFIKTNGYFNTSYEDNRPLYKKFFKGAESNLQLFGKHHAVEEFVPSQEYNLLSTSRSLLSKTITGDIPNRSLSNDFNVLTSFNPTTIFNTQRANLNYIYVKTGLAPFPFLTQVRYRPMGQNILVATSALDNFDLFDGDVYISKVDITNIAKIYGEGINAIIPLLLTIGLLALLDKQQVNVEYELIEGLVFESIYNYDRRFEGTDPCSIYYNPQRPVDDVIMRRIADRTEVDGNRDWRLKDSVCMEWYGNNADFNISDPLKVFYPLGQLYDYCSKCLNKYPNDIVYSEVSTGEDVEDNFLVFRPLNRVALPADGGEIIKGDLVGSKLLIRSRGKSYLLFPNAQEMQVTDATVYLGTGSFLATPPVPVSGTSSGFAGQQDKLSSVLTPFGVVWIDRLAGAVYAFNGEGIDELSNKGLFHYFEEELKEQEGEFLLSAKVAYNPLWKSVVMTAPKFRYIGLGEFTTVNNKYYVDGQEVFLHQVAYFENLSFTISYSFEEKGWMSWHSYMPQFMYQNLTTMFTSNGAGVYAHNNWQSVSMFYGQTFPVGVEINFASAATFQNAATHYYATFEEYDADERTWRLVTDVNFDKAWAYTNSQSSGFVDLSLPDSAFSRVGWSSTIKQIEIKDTNMRIAALRDIAIDSLVVSKAWSRRFGYYNNGQGYMDKVPVNVDYDKEQQDQVLFRDKVLSLRLFITNPKVRMTYHFGSFFNMPSNR